MKFTAYRTDELAPSMQQELNALLRSLTIRYGAATVEVATHMENMRQMCVMVAQNLALTGADHERAMQHVHTTCMNALNLIGATLRVSRKDALACAAALREHSKHMEAEILGEDATGLPTVEAEAKDAIMKAANHA
jgi:hypothetical protein